MPAGWSHGDPVDIVGDAPPERYAAALQVLLEARGRRRHGPRNCPTAAARAIDTRRGGHRHPGYGTPHRDHQLARFAAAQKRVVRRRQASDLRNTGRGHPRFMILALSPWQDVLMEVPPALAEG
jgi:acetyltransferase